MPWQGPTEGLMVRRGHVQAPVRHRSSVGPDDVLIQRIMRHPRQLIRSVVAAAALVAGCGGSEPTKPTITVTTVSVAVSNTQLEVAATQTATAEVRDQNNAVITGRTITWASLTPGVATVSSNGLITAVAP